MSAARSPAALLALVVLGLALVAAGCTSSNGEEPAAAETAAVETDGGGGEPDGGEVDTGEGTEAATAPEEPPSEDSENGGAEESPGATQPGDAEQGPNPPGIVVSDSSLGPILTDPDGYTLYLFTQDSKKRSVCTGECAATFPPVTSEDGRLLIGTGVNKELLGSIEHPDAGVQVTYNGHPLYRFVDDVQPGDMVGHGVGNVWFVLSPAGDPLPAPDDG